MLAAHALVASFLGGATIRVAGLDVLGSIALATLVIGLVVSAILLAPWHLKFAVNARDLYDELDEQAAEEAEAGTLGWLAAAGFGYQALREENTPAVRRMSRLSGLLGVLVVAQTVAGLTALAVRWRHGSQATPARPDQAALDLDRHRGRSRRQRVGPAPAGSTSR